MGPTSIQSSGGSFTQESCNDSHRNWPHSSVSTVFTSSSLGIYPTVITMIDMSIGISGVYFLLKRHLDPLLSNESMAHFGRVLSNVAVWGSSQKKSVLSLSLLQGIYSTRLCLLPILPLTCVHGGRASWVHNASALGGVLKCLAADNRAVLLNTASQSHLSLHMEQSSFHPPDKYTQTPEVLNLFPPTQPSPWSPATLKKSLKWVKGSVEALHLHGHFEQRLLHSDCNHHKQIQ